MRWEPIIRTSNHFVSGRTKEWSRFCFIFTWYMICLSFDSSFYPIEELSWIMTSVIYLWYEIKQINSLKINISLCLRPTIASVSLCAVDLQGATSSSTDWQTTSPLNKLVPPLCSDVVSATVINNELRPFLE